MSCHCPHGHLMSLAGLAACEWKENSSFGKIQLHIHLGKNHLEKTHLGKNNSFGINETITFQKSLQPSPASTKVEHARANLLRGKGRASQKMAMKKGGFMGFHGISWEFMGFQCDFNAMSMRFHRISWDLSVAQLVSLVSLNGDLMGFTN